jgi:hypothetical protein
MITAPQTELALLSESAKPTLWVYYPFGSTLAGESARNLAIRVGATITAADFRPQANLPRAADLPKVAVIRFSEERNHSLARVIGNTVGALGYSWKIESAVNMSGAQRNTVEVWLPTK